MNQFLSAGSVAYDIVSSAAETVPAKTYLNQFAKFLYKSWFLRDKIGESNKFCL